LEIGREIVDMMTQRFELTASSLRSASQ